MTLRNTLDNYYRLSWGKELMKWVKKEGYEPTVEQQSIIDWTTEHWEDFKLMEDMDKHPLYHFFRKVDKSYDLSFDEFVAMVDKDANLLEVGISKNSVCFLYKRLKKPLPNWYHTKRKQPSKDFWNDAPESTDVAICINGEWQYFTKDQVQVRYRPKK